MHVFMAQEINLSEQAVIFILVMLCSLCILISSVIDPGKM